MTHHAWLLCCEILFQIQSLMTKKYKPSVELERIVIHGLQRIIALKTETDTLGCQNILHFMLSNVTNYSSLDHTFQMFCFWQHMPSSAWSLLSCTNYPLQHMEHSSVIVYMNIHSFSFCSYSEKQMSKGIFTSRTDWHQTRSWHPGSAGNWWAKCKLTRSQHSSAWLSAPSSQG